MPKKAPTKTKEPKFPKNYTVNGKLIRRVWRLGKAPKAQRDETERNPYAFVAIERGERLEKIVELMERTVGAKLLKGDGSGLYYVERKHWNAIYKLAKGS